MAVIQLTPAQTHRASLLLLHTPVQARTGGWKSFTTEFYSDVVNKNQSESRQAGRWTMSKGTYCLQNCHHIKVLLCVLATPHPTQLPANGLEKAVENGRSAWDPANFLEDLDEAPVSGLWPGSVLTTVVT